jgi:hypothetical protein
VAPASPSSRSAAGPRQSLFGEGPLEPLSRRLLQTAGVLSLLLILVVLNSLLNNSGGESPFNPNPVAAAAQRTQEVPGMRMNVAMQITSESSAPVTVTGKGVYNGETNLAEATYSGATSEGQKIEFSAVLGEDAWYFRYPQLASRMPEGKEWIKLSGFPGQKDMSSPGMASPTESLGMLRATGDVKRLGRQKIGGAQTTRYRLTMTGPQIVESLRSQGKDELAEQVEQAEPQLLGPVHAEVFIAKSGMLRRMRLVTAESIGGKTVTVAMRFDLFDFGIKPAIQIPDDSRVYELSPDMEEGLDSLGQLS